MTLGRIRRYLGRFAEISSGERVALIEALCTLAGARVLIKFVPFERLAPWVGRPRRETSAVPRPAEGAAIRRVGWAVGVAGRLLPGNTKCLALSVGAKVMLRRRGIASTLYIGVRRDGSREALEAHAWLRSGAIVLTGDGEREHFDVVSSFV